MTTRFFTAVRLGIATLSAALVLVACSSDDRAPRSGSRFLAGDGLPTEVPVDVASVPDAVPVQEPLSRTGNHPYQVYGRNYVPLRSSRGYQAEGFASWYGTKFHGRKTSSGEPYDMYAMSAAHRTLPLPSYLRVTNLYNQRSVVVKVNDRGPFVEPERRVIDLSYAAAVRLDMIASGTVRVRIEAVQPQGSGRGAEQGIAVTAATENLDAEYASFLQMGAFSDRNGADMLIRRVGEIDVEVFVEQVGDLYKVKAGPYPDADRALQQKLEIDRRLNIETMVVFE